MKIVRSAAVGVAIATRIRGGIAVARAIGVARPVRIAVAPVVPVVVAVATTPRMSMPRKSRAGQGEAKGGDEGQDNEAA